MAYINNIRTFIRVMELGNLSAAGRDLRISPAVASHRVKELEKHLGVRLFNRTTRQLTPTEHGKAYYKGAKAVIEAVEMAEAAVADISKKPKGVIHVMAQLGPGRRIIAPLIPDFNAIYPGIDVRLRLTDRKVDMMTEGIDVAFALGLLEDSALRMRGIANCARVICAAPSYLKANGTPQTADDLLDDSHNCLLLRFPGSKEYYWTLQTQTGLRKLDVRGPFDTDDGDVLIDWALAGHGLINKAKFEIAAHLASGALVPVLPDTPPVEANFACLYPHKRFQDPKVRLFIDFMSKHCRIRINELMAPLEKARA